MSRNSGHAGEGTVQLLVFLGIMLAALILAGLAFLIGPVAAGIVIALGVVIGRYIAGRFKVIAQWENAPLMKFGKIRGFAAPGIN